jgi:hypothetical protein
MKTPRMLICVLAAGTSMLISFGQESVPSPAKRQVTLDLAGRLLAPQSNPAASLPSDLLDPFNPPGFGAVPTSGPGKPGETIRTVSTDREILQNIATRITPSGMVMFGSQPLLLFREKKLKVGENLTITFEGNDYVVVISEINRTSFKIRFNQEEITRPIKPGKVP